MIVAAVCGSRAGVGAEVLVQAGHQGAPRAGRQQLWRIGDVATATFGLQGRIRRRILMVASQRHTKPTRTHPEQNKKSNTQNLFHHSLLFPE